LLLVALCLAAGVELESRFQVRDRLLEGTLPSVQEIQSWAGKLTLVVKQRVSGWIDGVANPSSRNDSVALAGKVVKVVDGDTLELHVDRTIHVIRLDQIDAPEIGQPWGRRARQALHRRVAGQKVIVEVAGVDRYERLLATLLLEGQNINREMVRSGDAWAYKQYLTESSLLDAEAAAREARMGLWRGADPIPPWEWRRLDR
jgi:endonuclease YncB( thermonuclease family)